MRVAIAFLLAATFALAEDKIDGVFAIWDANKDGVLTPDELPDAAIFKKVDADGDGRATRDEVARFLKIPVEKEATKPKKAKPAKKAESKSDGGVRQAPRTLKERVADFFRRLDANKDGKVQKTEFRGASEEVFKEYDRNKDDALSQREVTRYIREQLEAAKRNPRPDNFFELFDRNRDDKVTRSEYDGPAEFFRRYDHNRDRVVTRAELNMGAGGGRMMRGDEQFMADGPTRAPKAGLLERYDKNGDKRITLEELGGAESILQRLDRNGDGVLSGREVR